MSCLSGGKRGDEEEVNSDPGQRLILRGALDYKIVLCQRYDYACW